MNPSRQTFPARIVPGHRVASGQNGNPLFPGGTLKMQTPFFQALGLDLSDLFGAERGKRGRKPVRAKATDVAFRSPQGETWSGRGRPPRWIVDLEAKGHKREKFRV